MKKALFKIAVSAICFILYAKLMQVIAGRGYFPQVKRLIEETATEYVFKVWDWNNTFLIVSYIIGLLGMLFLMSKIIGNEGKDDCLI